MWYRLPFLLLGMFLLTGFSHAQESPAVHAQTTPAQAGLDVYVRDGCPHCADAKAFLPAFQVLRPWLAVVCHQVDRDPATREALDRATERAGL